MYENNEKDTDLGQTLIEDSQQERKPV